MGCQRVIAMLYKPKSVICGFMCVVAVLTACWCRAQGMATAAEIAHMPWDEANISTLRSLDRDSIQNFVNSPEAYGAASGEGQSSDILPTDVLQFAWADFAG
jgi:hypothetical protein